MSEEKVNNTRPATFASTACGHADFAHAAASLKQVALLGMACEFALKSGVVIVADHLVNQPRERGGFDESQQASRV
jgi:hypothetical protein